MEPRKKETTLNERDEALKKRILNFLERNKLPDAVTSSITTYPLRENDLITSLTREELTIREKIIEWNEFAAAICLEDLEEIDTLPDLHLRGRLTQHLIRLMLARRLTKDILWVDLPRVENPWKIEP